MPFKSLSIAQLKNAYIAGGVEIANNQAYIDELNVFPVPDGDTGSNLTATVTGASDAIKNNEYTDLFTLGKTYSRNLLMNARGNSGVIFSQIMKGFNSVFKEGQTELNLEDIVTCFKKATEIAYMSVAQPVEGTILTVIRVTSEKLQTKTYEDIESLLVDAIKFAEEILAKTPDLLPALKEVGVVDSGGYGLVKYLKGFYNSIVGNTSTTQTTNTEQPKKNFIEKYNDNNDGFGYCNEFIMTLGARVTLSQKPKEKFDLATFRKNMGKLGDSMVVVVDENILKVHIHSTKPYEILEYASHFGEFDKVKVENMTNQFLAKNPGTTLESMAQEKKNKEKPKKEEVMVVATVASETLAKLYDSEFQIKNTINTEISGNPSIQEFLQAINATKSKNVIIVVDDSNVILAAKSASELAKGVNCQIVAAKNPVASYLAAEAFDPVADIKRNIKNIDNKLYRLTVGQISISVKPVKYSHINVKKGDYIGIINKKIEVSDKNFLEAAKKLVDELIYYSKKPKNACIIKGINLSSGDCKEIESILVDKYGLKVEVVEGNIPVYDIYIGLY